MSFVILVLEILASTKMCAWSGKVRILHEFITCLLLCFQLQWIAPPPPSYPFGFSPSSSHYASNIYIYVCACHRPQIDYYQDHVTRLLWCFDYFSFMLNKQLYSNYISNTNIYQLPRCASYTQTNIPWISIYLRICQEDYWSWSHQKQNSELDLSEIVLKWFKTIFHSIYWHSMPYEQKKNEKEGETKIELHQMKIYFDWLVSNRLPIHI